mmetsp:Transcript_127893/g.368402  ORF Transcript_127893/g.368402 Transcript_127893/m.368402 type:complete len:259 (+) Transcript_127893:509-1285(+)
MQQSHRTVGGELRDALPEELVQREPPQSLRLGAICGAQEMQGLGEDHGDPEELEVRDQVIGVAAVALVEDKVRHRGRHQEHRLRHLGVREVVGGWHLHQDFDIDENDVVHVRDDEADGQCRAEVAHRAPQLLDLRQAAVLGDDNVFKNVRRRLMGEAAPSLSEQVGVSLHLGVLARPPAGAPERLTQGVVLLLRLLCLLLLLGPRALPRRCPQARGVALGVLPQLPVANRGVGARRRHGARAHSAGRAKREAPKTLPQ